MDPITPIQVLALSCKTTIIMVLLFVGYRFLGKRQTAQLNLYDLVTVMAVSNAVQNGMTNGRGNLVVGLVCSSTIILIAWAVTRLIVRQPKLESKAFGVPTIIVTHGHKLTRRMLREHVSDEELDAAMRQHGLDDVASVKLAVLEIDGTISIVPN